MVPTTVGGETWSLEVVRGRDPGRVFSLAGSEVVLGNEPGDRNALNFADQEGNSPRKMAGRHAALDRSPGGLSIRDLESPGGTFVNRRRVLPGRAEPLRDGDLIQLGAVQLRVVANPGRGARAIPASTPGAADIPVCPANRGGERAARPDSPSVPSPFSYPMPVGPACRTWDDILAVSSQRWEAVRDELTSGRLASFLVSIGRADLAPSPDAPGTPDDRLDAWLGALPTSRPARPELDVYPGRIVVKVTPGGGTVRRVFRVSNVGDRLLRCSARVEPPGVTWLSVANGPFVAAEGTEVPIEIAVPDTLPVPLKAEVVIEGNGGAKRVTVILEAKQAIADPSGPTVADEPTPVGDWRLSGLISRQSRAARVATWALAALAARILVGVASGSIGADVMTASGAESPGLGRIALTLAGLGAIAGGWGASRRGGRREVPTGAFAGGLAGVLLAAGLVAACRSVEPVLGPWASSAPAVGLLWAAIGAGLAALSTLIVKGDA